MCLELLEILLVPWSKMGGWQAFLGVLLILSAFSAMAVAGRLIDEIPIRAQLYIYEDSDDIFVFRNLNPVGVLAVVTSVLTFTGLPICLFFSRCVQLIPLAIFWMSWLSVGIYATIIRRRCNSLHMTVNSTVDVSVDECTLLSVLTVFGFMCCTILSVYVPIHIRYMLPPISPEQTSSEPNQQPSNAIPLGGYAGSQLPQSTSRVYPNRACLLCRRRPKNGRFDFCGVNCRAEARNLSPMLLEVPEGHITFTMVERQFQQSWKPANRASCPRVKHVYRVVDSSNSVESYYEYLRTHGNECFRYHGTKRRCQLGNDGYTTLCTYSLCNACSIIRTSFDVSLPNPSGALGQGIYTSSASNESANYSDSNRSGVMFLTKVVLGNVHNVEHSADVRSYQSVVYDGMDDESNETVVYTHNAIRPVYLIVFG